MTTQEILQGVHDWTNGKIVYDISVAHPDGQGNPTPYTDLTAALGTNGVNIPESLRKGGMSVKFVQSSDNKYVTYMYIGTSTAAADFTNTANWQPITSELEKVKDISREEIQNTEEKIAIQDDNNNDIVTITESGVNAVDLKVNNKRVATETDLDDINADIAEVEGVVENIENNKEEGFTEDSIEFQDSSGNIVGTIDSEGANFKNLKKNGVEIPSYPATVEETYQKGEEIVFEGSEENPVMKISESGVKVSNITDMEGNPIVPSYEHPFNIPDDLYVAAGRELCIYADSVINSSDRGLLSPTNYRVVFTCDVGYVLDRLYRLVPTNAQIGIYDFRTRVFDTNNQLVIDKTSTLHVISGAGFNSAKNILFVGASRTRGTVDALISHFAELTGSVQPNFVGSCQGNGGNFEGYGGWRYYDFAGVGRPAYRCQVSGITTIMVGAVYSDGTNNFTVKETNIDGDGSGNIALSFVTGVSTLPETLSKVSGIGDSTITIDSFSIEGNNKFWNFQTNELDIANYRQIIGLTDKIDIVAFGLGTNDANYEMSIESVKNNIIELYNAFVADNPNCKIIIPIIPTCCNTIGGTRTNGAAAYDIEHFKPYHWGYIKMFFDYFDNNPEYPNIRIGYVAQVDRYYGFPLWEYTISKYITQKAIEGGNLFHPNENGYNQLAEAYLNEILALA